MNKVPTEYWNSYTIWNLLFFSSKYWNPRNEPEALVLVKECNK